MIDGGKKMSLNANERKNLWNELAIAGGVIFLIGMIVSGTGSENFVVTPDDTKLLIGEITIVPSVGYPTAGPKVLMPAPIDVPVELEFLGFPKNFDLSQIELGYQFYPAPEENLVAIEMFFQEEEHKDYKLSILDDDSLVIPEIVIGDGNTEFMHNYIKTPTKIQIEYLKGNNQNPSFLFY